MRAVLVEPKRKIIKLNGRSMGQSQGEVCAKCRQVRTVLYELPCPDHVIDASCLHSPMCAECR